MAPPPPDLPDRFPCWCRAVYSWGGETKRDLGFIEGDLIECLNAGDGSWWMGRLKRDRRMVGLFPSNFVQVLDESFQPGSRNVSPMPAHGGSNGSTPSPAPPQSSPAKSKSIFRKPFTAYAAAGSPNPTAAARRVQQTKSHSELSPAGSLAKRGPYATMKRPSSHESRAPSPAPSHLRAVSPAPSTRAEKQNRSRAPSPAPSQYYAHSRAASPAPMQYDTYSGAASPAPMQHHAYSRAASPAPTHHQAYSRVASPAPSMHYDNYTRAPSPYQEIDASPPPPAPPPHRVAYQPSRALSPRSFIDEDYDDGHHSPAPQTPHQQPRRNGFTPSPLTSAMNDVMSSLQTMSLSRRSSSPDEPPTPPNVWSPEAFDAIYQDNAKKGRAQTSLGIGPDAHEGYEEDYFSPRDDGENQVASYVQRMESRLRRMHEEDYQQPANRFSRDPAAPIPPPKNSASQMRPQSSLEEGVSLTRNASRKSLRSRKSAYELGREVLGRTFTTKTNSTLQSSSTNATQSTHRSLMSGVSASGISATSAGSLARRKWGLGSQRRRPVSVIGTRADAGNALGGVSSRPETPFTGVTYHSSHDSGQGSAQQAWSGGANDSASVFGGLASPKPKKSGFLKKMIESAKTGAASARSTISANGGSRPVSRQKNFLANGISSISGGSSMPPPMSNAAHDMGLWGNVDWVQVRRDVNRSNSLSKNERIERAERCQMLDFPVLNPIDILYDTAEGDEGLDGLPITDPTDFSAVNLSLVDKNSRFIQGIPPMTTAASLAQGYVCRPYRSDVQRLRAIFTWVSERIGWEEDFEGEVDSRRVIQSKRGCSEEVAVLVAEMCASVGLHAEVVRGYLKTPGETLDFDMAARPNHWWNAVIVDGEWRIMDCSLASPSNPKRGNYSTTGSQVAESWWFLTRPLEICFTHVPLLPEQQHICPPLQHDVLMALPCACPPYFKHELHLAEFDTSMCCLESLELAHIHIVVPDDVECVAEVEARTFARDADGDYFESGDTTRKRALSQPEWIGGQKRYTVKALLPGEEGHGVLKVYAGKRGLMHSIKSNPHALALALPVTHTGTNPAYSFLTLHPTPHAQRHDLYVAQPQCHRLVMNNTFVFTVRQHPSSLSNCSPNLSSTGGSSSASNRATSPHPFARPTSAMSMASISAAGSNFSHPSSGSNPSSSATSAGSSLSAGASKPAKLAVQSPAGKIIRLMRRSDYGNGNDAEGGDGTVWETVIKVGERGTWRGLVLADRSARWCVFAEWECV